MTQIESLQQSIHEARVQLHKYRSVVIKDDLQKAHIEAGIEEILEELKVLRFCLKCAVHQASK